MQSWADQLRRHRRVHGMTQSALAETLGVEQATVSRWERGVHQPELGVQRRLRDILHKPSDRADRMVRHRILNAISAVKIADRTARNFAASQAAGRLHGLNQQALATCHYRPFFTEILAQQWNDAISNGFFAGDIAGIKVFTSWRPAGGAAERYCVSLWSPVWMSDGDIMLVSEFADISEDEFKMIAPAARFEMATMDELVN